MKMLFMLKTIGGNIVSRPKFPIEFIFDICLVTRASLEGVRELKLNHYSFLHALG